MDDQAADHVASALYDLKAVIEKQMQQQEETNDLMRTLIHTLQMTGQATADLASAMVEDE